MLIDRFSIILDVIIEFVNEQFLLNNMNNEPYLFSVNYDHNGNLLKVPHFIIVDLEIKQKFIKNGIQLALTPGGGIKVFMRNDKRFYSKKDGGPGSSLSEEITGKYRARRKKDADKNDYRLSAYVE